jgi:putative redox protein
MNEVVVKSLINLQNQVRYNEDGRSIITDEPRELGGDDAGPDPYSLLLGALGSCISMTVKMYAKRKGWNLEGIEVRLSHERIHAEDCQSCETTEGFVLRINRAIEFRGDLTDEQRARLHDIALKCPLHKTLGSEITFGEIERDTTT